MTQGIQRLASAFRGSPWPYKASAAALVVGAAMLLATWQIREVATEVRNTSARQMAQIAGRAGNQAGVMSPVRAGLEALPPEETYLEDLGRSFQLAREQGLAIGTIDYLTERHATLPILSHTVNFRFREDYPRLKAFTASMLTSMPHVVLHEIRIERKDAADASAQALLKFSFVYQDIGRMGTVQK